MCIYTHKGISTHTHSTYMHPNLHIHAHEHTYIYMNMHTYHTHTHTNIHVICLGLSRPLMINIHCQRDSTWKHLGDTPLGTLVWRSQKRLTVREDLLWIWWQESWTELKAPASISALLLCMQYDQLPHVPMLPPHLVHHDGLYSQSLS